MARSIREELAELAELTARQSALKAVVDRRRDALLARLLEQVRTEGAVPNYKLKGLGTVALSCADPETPTYTLGVTDEAALVAYVAREFPSEIEIAPRVRPAFLAALTEGAKVLPDGTCMTPEGELVPGITGTLRPPGLRVTIEPALKADLVARLEEELEPEANSDPGRRHFVTTAPRATWPH